MTPARLFPRGSSQGLPAPQPGSLAARRPGPGPGLRRACAAPLLVLGLLAWPCHAGSGFASGAGNGPLVARAHLDFRIVILPSMALRLDAASARVTASQDSQLQWQAGPAVSAPAQLRSTRMGLDRTVPLTTMPAHQGPEAARPPGPGLVTLAAP
jgi:hypothetical protein